MGDNRWERSPIVYAILQSSSDQGVDYVTSVGPLELPEISAVDESLSMSTCSVGKSTPVHRLLRDDVIGSRGRRVASRPSLSS